MGLICIQNSSLLVYGKSQKVSAPYCLPFQHSRGKNQPVGGFQPPRACLGLIIRFSVTHLEKRQNQNYVASINSYGLLTLSGLLTLLPKAFYDFLSYRGGIFIPHPRKQC